MQTHARLKLSAAQRQYKSGFDRKVSFRPVTNTRGFVYVDTPPHALAEAGRRETRSLDKHITDVCHKILPKSYRQYCVRSATDTVVHIVRDAITTRVSIDRVTRLPTGAMRCSPPQPLVVRQPQEPPPQKPLPVLALQHRAREKPVWSEGMRKNISSSNLSSITARKLSCSTVLDSMATTLRKTHTSLPSGCHSPSFTVTGERFRRSDRIPVDRNVGRTTHSRTGSGSRNEQTDREKTAVLRRGLRYRHRHGALDNGGEERTYGPRIHDRHGVRGAKEQRNERTPY